MDADLHNTFSSDISPEVIGQKAFYLYRMQEYGLPVPSFFVLSTQIVDKILNPVKGEIEELEALWKNGLGSQEACQSLLERLNAIHIDPRIIQKVLNKCSYDFGENYSVSVRSSGTLEDGKRSSFAGQFRTELEISALKVRDSIIRCIASGWTFEVFTYRRLHGLLDAPLKMAVIIQEMVNTVRSGVAFSMNIQGNLAESLIIAGHGPGEAIVSDMVSTEMYYVDRQHETIFFDVNDQGAEGIIHAKDRMHSTLKSSVLHKKEIKEIFELCMRAEKLLGTPSDIEFSIDIQGKLFILQMRPISTIEPDKLIILDNTNIIESYPGITLPLSYSFALAAYDAVFRNSANSFWLSKKEKFELNAVFSHLIYHFDGRIYYRMENWFKMLALVYGSKSGYEDWEKAVGFKNTPVEWKAAGKFKKIKLLVASANMLIQQKWQVKRFFSHFNDSYQKYRSYSSIKDNPDALWKHFKNYRKEMLRYWHYTIANDYLAFKYFGLLTSALEKTGIDESQHLANDLVANRYSNRSEEAVLSVLCIKEKIISDPDLLHLFEGSEKQIVYLLQKKENSELQKLIQDHIEEYGDRMLAELKLENRSFRQHPEAFITLLKKQIHSSVRLKDHIARKERLYSLAEERMDKVLKKSNLFNKLYIRWLLAKSSKGIRNRENMRFCRAKGYGLVREIFYTIGESLVKKGKMEEPSDLFYLHLDELKNYCITGHSDVIIGIIQQRKQEFNSFSYKQLPDRIIFDQKHPPRFGSPRNFDKGAKKLKGLGVSSGIAEAEVIVISQASYELDVKGKIMVTRMTDPGWIFLMSQSAGIISEKGSLLSHSAIVGRELGLPVIVGVENATQILCSGQRVRLNAYTGEVELLDN